MRSGDRCPAMASHERAALLTVTTSASEPSLDGLYPFCKQQQPEAGTQVHSSCGLPAPPSPGGPTWNVTQHLPATGPAVPWQDEVGSWGPCPLFEKGAELKWVYTGTSNDKMYIEIYKDFYINLIKQ